MNFRTAWFLLAGSILFLISAQARAQAPAPVFKQAPAASDLSGSPAPANSSPPAAAATPPAETPPAPAAATPAAPAANAPSPPGYPPGYAPPPGYPPPAGYPPGTTPPPSYPPGSYPYPYQYPYPYPYPYASGQPGQPYSSSAYPPPPPPPTRSPSAEVHDGGYIRLQLGVDWFTGLTGTAGSDTVTYNGSGASLAAAFGYSITPHLILYAEFLIAGAADVAVKMNGVLTNTGQSNLGTDITAVGAGAAYYFGPNVFAAATVLDAHIDITDSNDANLLQSDNGLGLELLFGKEWWASDNWGLGVSGQFIFASMKGKDVDLVLNQVPTWHATSFSLLFSATYN